MSENAQPQTVQPTTPPASGESEQPKTFTQDELNKAISDRLKRERERFADYDELKAKAEGAKSDAERLADLERRLAEADARDAHRALVDRIATEFDKVRNREDIALFLTGPDEETLRAQAKRLNELTASAAAPPDNGARITGIPIASLKPGATPMQVTTPAGAAGIAEAERRFGSTTPKEKK